ncbi:MAG: hypothetical protein EOO39_35050 [Cytophagaceae bacterium]|nr:MAG: hypothetical protein EOO39_35050 [Cytophagaceae bacterium]
MSESTVRLILAAGGLLLAGSGGVELWCAHCAGMPLSWPVWWATLFLFGIGFASICLLRPTRNR